MGVGEVGMNATACSALLQSVVWDEPALLASLALLAVIDVMVVLGNCLVIAAVFISSKLRSVTNLFIVSLAVADLLVGLAVLPFSATWEVFKVWIFGDVWCSMWLAVDVWMCTASILNLCAISLDRYVAVTRPVTYPSIMSMGRAKLLIAAVWILSFLICFPPLVGWKDNVVAVSSNETGVTPEPPCPWRCELTNEAGYVIYSALGSFYIPMFVMLFFYWRIYRAAVQTTRAINRGFRTTKGSRSGIGNRFDEQRLTLRIHRGRGSVMRSSGPNSNSTTTTNSAANSVGNSPGGQAAVKSPETRQSSRRTKRPNHERIKISVSYPSSDRIASEGATLHEPEEPPVATHTAGSAKSSSVSSASSPPGVTREGSLYAVQCPGSETTNSVFKKDGGCHLRVTGSGRLRRGHSAREDRSSSGKDLSPSPTYEEAPDKPKLISRMGKRNIKAQVKRFRMETKAAKTLGIIVGGFIVCWLPFFTMYLVRAFCGDDCIHPTVFSVLFWLGYCNSAINPCIYALFSKDFRFAFKRIICRCLCSRRGGSSTRQRRGSDGSQLGGGARRSERHPSTASACHNHTELHHNCHYNNNNHHNHSDSDPNNEPGSDSR